MAKTTKVVNKRTTSSKNSNTNNGKGFFGKSFDLKSRKVQFFVVILIVAILGGGYFTLKSFAATVAYSYSPVNNTLVCKEKCKKVNDTGIAKNSTTVLSITSLGKVAGSSNAYMVGGDKYQTCIVVKAQDNLSYLEVQPFGQKPNLFGLSSANNTYQKACTPPWTNSTTGYRSVSISGVNRGKTPILIENVTIERVTFNANAPAPK
ncbi:MAG: hypothetical protein U0413_04420 [Candidatus Saccharimonadales bacterium]